MTVKATTNFSGTVSMAKGEERELPAGLLRVHSACRQGGEK